MRFDGDFRQRLAAVAIMLIGFGLFALGVAKATPGWDEQRQVLLDVVIGLPLSIMLARWAARRWFGTPEPIRHGSDATATNRPRPRTGGTPLSGKIFVIAVWLGILVAVVGSFIAPRADQVYFFAGAVLIPGAAILLARLLGTR